MARLKMILVGVLLLAVLYSLDALDALDRLKGRLLKR